ncbi:MAG: flagellar basal body rod protein FlgF [Pseudomonadales bacterium]|jgi:flagellar basal-body rod protein FlgF|nr:flagellar basal body rod protein FlgF [Pseudomonadales bacterium]
MDRMLYVAMAGAKQTLRAQGVAANNLANTGTTGFRADLESFMSVGVQGPGHGTRTYGVIRGHGVDTTPGALERTDNPLDVAVSGSGWFVVQTEDGSEAYTRSGAFQVDPSGILRTAEGLPVLGQGGPIAVPPYEQILIADDGTISVRPMGAGGAQLAQIDRLRLVDPDPGGLVKGPDGLVRTADGLAQPPSASVKVASGMLEASNVNAVQAMLRQLDLARQFEVQMKIMTAARDNDDAADRLLRNS